MHTDFADPIAMLPMPRLDTRTPEQAEGARCVWCGGRPVAGLGSRVSTCRGALVQWTPRACQRCIRREAGRVYRLHIPTCPRCGTRTYCPDAVALYGLSQASAASRTGPAAG